ncbi:MAG TPA: START domain-containing protein, partial [Vulgatibacter sp.]|nr:START domain-containing protein [Vulgatibacter sp.]
SRRDYCVEIKLSEGPDGVLSTEWKPANELAPPKKKGVVRVSVNDGSWTLVPTNGGRATRATYRLHVDPGGKLPRWIIERTNRKSVPDAFRAVRKAATSKRYADAPSPLARAR